MLIILLVLLLLSLLLYNYTSCYNENLTEGLNNIEVVHKNIEAVNNALSNNPEFLGMETARNIQTVSAQVKDFGNIRKLSLQNQANVAFLNTQLNNLETIKKRTAQNTNGVSSLTKQVNNLAGLTQDATDLSSQIDVNVKLIAKLGKNIQQAGFRAVTPGEIPDPLPRPTGNVWPAGQAAGDHLTP